MLYEILSEEGEKVILRIDKKSAITLTKNITFHERNKHVLSKYHFICDCVENEPIEMEYVADVEKKAYIYTKPLARNKFKQMTSLIGV